MIDGRIVNLRGTLTVISADNPAANLIGGYKSLTSAFRKCRTCMAIEEDMQTKVHVHLTCTQKRFPFKLYNYLYSFMRINSNYELGIAAIHIVLTYKGQYS